MRWKHLRWIYSHSSVLLYRTSFPRYLLYFFNKHSCRASRLFDSTDFDPIAQNFFIYYHHRQSRTKDLFDINLALDVPAELR